MEGHARCAAVHRNPFLVHADGRSDNLNETSLLGVSRQVSAGEPHSVDERQIVLSRVYLHPLPPMIRHRALLITIIQASNAVQASVGSAASEGRANGTRASSLV